MPTISVAPSRAHRLKDRESRSSAPRSSSKGSRKLSKSSARTPPRSPSRSSGSIYSQQNFTLDTLPPLPESTPASPASVSSKIHPGRSTPIDLARIGSPPVPRALQAYVEDDQSDEETRPSPLAAVSPIKPIIEPVESLSKSDPTASDDSGILPEGELLPPAEQTRSAEPAQPAIPTPQSRSPEATPSEPDTETPLPTAPNPPEEDIPKAPSPAPSQALPYQSVPPSPAVPPYFEQRLSPQLFSPAFPSTSYPTSPPIQGYTSPHQYYSPPYNNPAYYSMFQPQGYSPAPGYPVNPHQFAPQYQAPQYQSPQYPGAYPGFVPPTPAAMFSASPAQSPSLQRNGSVGSRSSLHANGSVGNPSTPPAARNDERAPTIDGGGGGAAGPEDAVDLLQRVQSAIPDLHALLNRYRDTYGQLGMREETLRKSESEQADAIRQKQQYIDSLAKQMEDSSNKHSAETNKLRLEIGNLEEKHKELQESLEATKKAKEELEEAKASLENDKMDLEKQRKLEAEALAQEFVKFKKEVTDGYATEKKSLEDKLAAELKEKTDAFEAEKTALAKAHEEAMKSLEDKLDAQLKEQADSFQTTKAAITKAHVEEKEALRKGAAKQKRDMEAGFDKLRNELESKLNGTQKDLEEALKKERESREGWSKEREELVRGWEEERTAMGSGWEEQRAVLTEHHEKEKEDQLKTWTDLQAEMTKKAEQERSTWEDEKAALQKGWDDEKAKFEKAYGELKSMTEHMGAEKDRLQKMVEAFGEVTDLKSKGDAYYLDNFSKLTKLIESVASEYFQNIPVPPPEHILNEIPETIPSFLSNTPSSRHLRTAYIQYKISTILCYRVYSPFLFSLGRRYDKADTLFQAMSNDLRKKSTRREAIWRQHTLYSAYTAANAKETINAAAGAVVEEIVSHIKHFTDPKYVDKIYEAVRRIVKLGAETWRLARLERELITARLPAAEDDAEIEDDWAPATFDDDHLPATTSATAMATSTKRKPILRLFPIIAREPIHEGFRSLADAHDAGCVYSHGVALYDDAQPVLTRLEELRTQSVERQSSFGRHRRRDSATPPSPLFPAMDEIDGMSPSGSSLLGESSSSSHRGKKVRETAVPKDREGDGVWEAPKARDSSTKREASTVRETHKARESSTMREAPKAREPSREAPKTREYSTVRETPKARESSTVRDNSMAREAAPRVREASKARETPIVREASTVRRSSKAREPSRIREDARRRDSGLEGRKPRSLSISSDNIPRWDASRGRVSSEMR
ncbi:MAG: hypothetical protein M1819_004628 [Sarea resinae]|nr:MAG: hypothetical protein M1819_004628 [Sarea resinae]